MAALAILEDIANGAMRRERVFKDREDSLAHDGVWLISRFRFPRAILLELCAELLEHNAEARYIKFSYNAVEQANIKAQFAARAGFPKVIGAIDCTHGAIKAPSHDEFVYVRKHFHSINVQIMMRKCN